MEVTCPVIFITAYDQYAIQAFKVNSIDYLLKPVKKEELLFSLNKLKNLTKPASGEFIPDMKALVEQLMKKPKAYQKRFSVKYGQFIKSIEVAQIALYYSEDKVVFIHTFDGERFPIDYSLDKLQELIDPMDFFRIHRSMIINYYAIHKMFSHLKGRIKIVLKTKFDEDILVSADRAADFREWLGR